MTPNTIIAPFRVRNFRFQWTADMLTSWAFEMELLILGWYVFTETGSVLLLTLLASLIYVGTLIAPVFGLIGDRLGHRDLLAIMRVIYAVLASILMLAALTGHLTPYLALAVVSVAGLVRPSDLGVRGALVATIMPHEQLIGAISISRTTQDTARIAGALSGAGLFVALGIGPAYVAIVVLYLLAAMLTLCVVAPARKPSVAPPSPLRDLKEGVAHVWTSPRMQAVMWVAFLANLTAYPLSNGLLPYIAKDIYGTTQTGLGYLSASFAIGSLIGSVGLSVMTGVRIARLMIGATVLWYGTLLVFAHSQTFAAGVACLFTAGLLQSLAMIAVAVILMRSASERFRGRVMGVRMLVIYGLPLGLLAAGSLIDVVGFTMVATLYAASGLALIIVIALHWRADLWHVHAQANAR